MSTALLLVDLQVDFLPGGSLPVVGGDAVLEPVNELIDVHDLVIATRDWHPPDHGSFVGQRVDAARWQGVDPPGRWPVHCVRGTRGAELHPALRRGAIDWLIDKGVDRHVLAYSGFDQTELADRLRDAAVEHLVVAGVATEHCVRDTVLDALRLGFAVTVATDAIAGVEERPGDCTRALTDMQRAGARIVAR